MSYSVHTTRYRRFHDELSDLLDIVLAGAIVTDRAVAERLVRWLGVNLRLLDQHLVDLDEHGCCGVCWAIPRHWWRRLWPQRSTCTVYTALKFWLRQPIKSVLAAIKDRPKTPRGSPQ